MELSSSPRESQSVATMTPETDDELLLRIHSGDEAAFVSLYRRRQGAIYRFTLHMSGSETAAEDITQEVFLTLLREGLGYRAGARVALRLPVRDCAQAGACGTWSGVATMWRWNGGTDDGAAGAGGGRGSPLDLTHREGLEALRRAVLALPRRYREVVVLCDLEEMDYADAADGPGLPDRHGPLAAASGAGAVAREVEPGAERKAGGSNVETGKVRGMNCEEFWNGEPHGLEHLQACSNCARAMASPRAVVARDCTPGRANAPHAGAGAGGAASGFRLSGAIRARRQASARGLVDGGRMGGGLVVTAGIAVFLVGGRQPERTERMRSTTQLAAVEAPADAARRLRTAGASFRCRTRSRSRRTKR